MKKAFILSSLTFVLFLLIANTVSAQTSDVSGKWNMTVELSAGSGSPVFMLKQEGETITGTYTGRLGEAPVTGTMKDKSITLNLKAGDYNVTYTGIVEGNTMKGKVAFGDAGEGTFTGTKEVKQ